jgi:hypothetical protein
MGVMTDLIREIGKAQSLPEVEPLLKALVTGAVILERENERLKAKVKKLETRTKGQESRGLTHPSGPWKPTPI